MPSRRPLATGKRNTAWQCPWRKRPRTEGCARRDDYGRNGNSEPQRREDPHDGARSAENPHPAREGWSFARKGWAARWRSGWWLFRAVLRHALGYAGTRPRQDFRRARRAHLRRPEKLAVSERHDARVRRDVDAPGVRVPESQRGAQLRLRQLLYGLSCTGIACAPFAEASGGWQPNSPATFFVSGLSSLGLADRIYERD